MDNYLNKVIGDRYEIQEIVGIGGMSVVYKAYDRVDDRIVAVKILKDEFKANEEFRMRFKNESKAVAVLSHPNIVKVYDVSFGENLQYIVMEYVEGITLKEYIDRQKTLDIREAEHFVIQILRALQHAHDKGIVHRDIKPQNIILLPNANIKVTDFGIARFNHMESKNVDETSAIGSVHYVSPEQAKGEYTDGRSDIYSVGVVLYEMLTGKVPFEADNDSSVALMQLQEDAVRPSLINPSIPVGLEQITLRAMQKDPADRYQSAAEFLSDLYEFKRNPQIKFDYTYFVDSDPTKHIDVGADLKRSVDAAAKAKSEPVPVGDPDDDIDDEEDDDDDDDEEEERNVTVPILIGIAVALILVIGAILLIAFGDQLHGKNNGNGTSSSESGESFWQKLDFLGLFSSDKIEVPNFLNMDFDDAREKYPNLAIDPEPQYVYNTTYESGKVIEQVPEAGEKVSPDTVIKLYVATNASMVQIPDVKSYNYKEAESILVAKGFTVELLQAFDETADEETVIYTDPNGSSYAAYGSKVYVYYASSSANALNGTRIPNVVGDQLSVAKQKILAAGLKVGAVTYNASSAALKNYVIGQNPVTGSQVTLGTYVNLVVGNGVTESSTSTYSITLPNTGAVGTVRTYLNGVPYNTYTNVLLNGSTFTVSFTGAGDANNFTVYVDSAKVASGSIDFSKPTGKLSDVSEYTYSARTAVPNVVGQTQDAAVKALKAAGFNNVSVQNVISNDVPAGKVVSQTPVSSTLTEYATSVTVVIYVSIGSSTPSSLAPSTTAAPPTVTMPPITEPPTQPTEPSEVTTEPVSGDEPSGDMYANGY